MPSGTDWELQTKLTATDGAPDDCFGAGVAISGDSISVGAPLDDVDSNIDQGSSYVFVADGGSWSQQKKLVAPEGHAYDRFGKAVAISSDRVVVRASDDDIGANADQGSAYSFVRTGTTWALEQRLFAYDGAATDYFGHAIGLDGDTIALSAPGDDGWKGSVYVFAPYTTPEDTPLTIAAPGVLANDTDADGDALGVLGLWDQPAHGTLTLSSAGGFIYTPDPGWSGTDGFSYQDYGWSNIAAVTIRVISTNRAPVANPDGALPLQVAELLAGDGATGDGLGYSVAISATP